MFLSGSFRTAWEESFQKAFGPNIQVLRESTTVPANTQYCVHLLSATSNLQDCQNFCAKHIKEAAKTSTAFKCMVFVPLVWHVNDTAATFRKQMEPSAVFTYLASDPPADQVSCYQRWLRDANLWIGGEIVDRLLVFGMRSSGRSLIFGSAFFWFQGVW